MNGYGFSAPFATRWNDNDVYGHVNNVIYYAAMDTTINSWLIGRGGLQIDGGDFLAVCASSSCEYRASASFPDQLTVGLRVGRIGTTSVTWETGIVRDSDGLLLAEGRFVHVFVDRESRRPVAIPLELRQRIEAELG